ncbi:RidA family protein [Aeromonas sp. ASNIH2]|uniref:RidA family protein n=1 Tax=Aeromonas sp. ASNIH2 TaxID=1636607 RepID=UPI000CDBEB50|nr:RidA family protein [Aeromonas sp. ASNIH2]AUY11028.1 hypothetical protein C3F36_17135 [Aeromonas sp. ASNIH2]
MNGTIIKSARNTPNAPQDLGPYTQSVAFSHYNNIAAQLPVDPKTGALVAGDIQAQARQCLTNIQAIVQSVGHGMEDMVKVTLFLADIADLDAVNAVYRAFFPHSLPTRTVLAVASLPLGARVQMDALLSNGEGTFPQAPCPLLKISRNSDRAPQDPLSSQSVAFSHYNHIAGQLPLDMATGKVLTGCVREQTAQCLGHIKTIVESIGHVMDDIVKVNIQLANIADLAEVDAIYAKYFPGYLPARTVIGVSELPAGALVQIDAVMSNAESTPPQV